MDKTEVQRTGSQVISEGWMYVTNHSTFQPFNCSTRKAAFTLAEVLITLGIIGVVAAITLPILVKNYQKQAYVAGLRKELAIANQAFKKILADEGVDKLSDTAYGYRTNNLTMYYDKYYFNRKPYLFFNLNKYIKFINSDCTLTNINYKFLGSSGASASTFLSKIRQSGSGALCSARMIDGSYWIFSFDSSDRIIIVDVNGDKKPNQWGRDVFTLAVSENGTVKPYDSGLRYIDCEEDVSRTCPNVPEQYKQQCINSVMSSCKPYVNQYNTCGKKGKKDSIKDASGIDCAKRIEQEGWKMDY